jgi:drug/metabolite transporter (DMT)-like permease
MSGRDWTLLLALSVLWGGSFLFVGVAVREWPPLSVALCRVAIGAAALLVLLRATGQRLPRGRGVWAGLLLMGLLNGAVPFSLYAFAQGTIPSGLAAILNATTPLFTLLVAHAATTDERITARKLAGIVLGVAGVAVLFLPDLVRGASADLAAMGACLLAALLYAFAGVFGRRFARAGLRPMQVAAGQVACAALILLPVAAVVDAPWGLPVPSVAAGASLLGVGLLSTALGYILYFRLLASAGPTNLVLVTFLIPVSAILFGVVLLGEALAARHVAGMALIGLGLAAIDGRVLRR